MPDDRSAGSEGPQRAQRAAPPIQTSRDAGFAAPNSQALAFTAAPGDARAGSGLADPPPPASLALLGDPRLRARGNGPVRLALLRRVQRTYGNRVVQRLLARGDPAAVPLQRQAVPDQERDDPGGAATAVVAAAAQQGAEGGAQQGTEAAGGASAPSTPPSTPVAAPPPDVTAEIEAFLTAFQHIPVTLHWQEGGEAHTEQVAVSPPYFINSTAATESRTRLETAQTHRTGASRAVRGVLRGQRRALAGKSTPEDLHRILQDAVDRGLVPATHGQSHPDAEDLHAWMVEYGIGVDCSGFVAQALNRIMAQAYGGAAPPGYTPLSITGTSSSMLGEGRRRGSFALVDHPADLRPGDLMHHPGHIRIIATVTPGADGSVMFSTAKSSSRGDVGPTSVTWRYPDGSRFAHLQRWMGPPPPEPAAATCAGTGGNGCWSTRVDTDRHANYTRYRPLAQAAAAGTSGSGP